MARRGPDEEKIWENVDSGIIFGFRRLAIRDLSYAGSQPMVSKSGRLVLVLNGEIYNVEQLCNWAEINVSELKGHSDTEVVLECFERKGTETTISRLDGIFALAVYDQSDDSLTLARDIAGVKPLYYGLCSRGLVFSSCYNHITSNIFFKDNKIIPEALVGYFTFGFIQEGEGLLEETYFMPHGHIIKINRQGKIYSKKYCFDNSLILNKNLADLFENIVESQLVSDVPIGTLMSGGVDSTLITGISASLKEEIKSFTISVDDEILDEGTEAERFGRYFNIKHNIHSITDEEVLNAMDQYSESAAEPLSDYSSLLTLKVSEIAKKELTVVLSGDGGDELYFGYPRFFKAYDHFTLLKLPQWLRIFKIFLLRIKKKKIPFELLKYKDFREYYLSKQGVPEGVKWSQRLIKGASKHFPYWFHVLNYKMDSEKLAMEFARDLEFHIHLQRVLLKVDRASMYHSLEVRTPLLSPLSVEASKRYGYEECVLRKVGKIPLRNLLADLIPENTIISRNKKGFSPPLATWLRTSLKDKVFQRIINMPPCLEFIIDVKEIKGIWDIHQAGKDQAWIIWSIFSLFDWVDNKMYNIDN